MGGLLHLVQRPGPVPFLYCPVLIIIIIITDLYSAFRSEDTMPRLVLNAAMVVLINLDLSHKCRITFCDVKRPTTFK